MHEAVEDGVCEGGVADGFVPPVNGELACHDGGGAAVAVLEDFQQVTALWGGEDGQSPIVNDRHIHASDGFEKAAVAAIAAGVTRQPSCPVPTTTLAGFEAAGVGVSFGVFA
jgi:hypothetical protein